MTADSEAAVLITGANGHLGKRLVEALSPRPVRAVVRSTRARDNLADWLAQRKLGNADIQVRDYLDVNGMREAAQDCSYAVHLVGIIKESAGNSFQRAHVDTTRVLLDALAGSPVARLCYLSILGAEENATNPCLLSRWEAEQMFQHATIPALVIRIPMVLGEGDYASRALLGRASAPLGFTFRGASLEQPVYAGDVIRAVALDVAAGNKLPRTNSQVLELAGPESLTRTALIQRAASVLGTRTRTLSLPLGLGLGIAGLLELLSDQPPVTRSMLQLLDHDDRVDPAPAAAALGIELTSLEHMISACRDAAR